MPKLTSQFVSEVSPYLISAFVAAVLLLGLFYLLMTVALPGVFYSDAYATETMVVSTFSTDQGENALEMIRQDHDAFAPDQKLLGEIAKAAETNLGNR